MKSLKRGWRHIKNFWTKLYEYETDDEVGELGGSTNRIGIEAQLQSGHHQELVKALDDYEQLFKVKASQQLDNTGNNYD